MWCIIYYYLTELNNHSTFIYRYTVMQNFKYEIINLEYYQTEEKYFKFSFILINHFKVLFRMSLSMINDYIDTRQV